MAPKFDVVIEAVRYFPDGQIDLVRAYERRGPAFSDHVLLDRQKMIEILKRGRRMVTGERLTFMAGTFKVGSTVRLGSHQGHEVIANSSSSASSDHLDGVPLF